MIALSESAPAPGPLTIGANLCGLALLVWGVTTKAQLGFGGSHLAALVLLVLAAGGWLGSLAARTLNLRRLTLLALTVMSVAGGALTPFSTVAVAFAGVASLGATIVWTLEIALWVIGGGLLAMVVSLWADGASFGAVLGGLTIVVAASVVGVTRRESQERAAQRARVQVSEARAEAQQARAELLDARNHLARELHDVLAHTLSALSLQLEAFDSLIGNEAVGVDELRGRLDGIKRLTREGLEEASGAVRALREDARPLDEQLARLAGDRAEVRVGGETRKLAPHVSMALYRVAQEALTNVSKHAPGAEACIQLLFGPDRVTLAVSNGPGSGPESPLARSGGGYGLQGIRERVLLLGGEVEAGPDSDGWTVRAEVPA